MRSSPSAFNPPFVCKRIGERDTPGLQQNTTATLDTRAGTTAEAIHLEPEGRKAT